MFEAVELGQSLPKSEFKAREPQVWSRLLELQQALRAAEIATLIIVSGPEGAGKGEVVDQLNRWFDTRGIRTHAFWTTTDEEDERPPLWRFWRSMPPRGKIAIMFGAWYWMPLYRRAHGRITNAELEQEALRIAGLERTLQADGMLIVKLWFHISRKTHSRCMQRRREVQKHIRGVAAEGKTGRRYGAFLKAAARMIRLTGADECPWQLIESEDRWFRDLRTAEVLVAAMEQRVTRHRRDRAETRKVPPDPAAVASARTLKRIDLGGALSGKNYARALKLYQRRLGELAWSAFDARCPTVIVLEGWDAAGKGGIIRRINFALDARLHTVVPIGAPSDEERAHHYLWRFWRHVPRAGFIAIYDRSWYGRVLVERVEKYAAPPEWMRAYGEINDFEDQLTAHGVVLLKFWLHISAREQLRRFRERERLPWKQYKITAEDWRNRERRKDYLQAVEAMVERTGTAHAPWTLVPAEDKQYARIMVLKTICKRLEAALEE